ncbi:uncharacterized protein FFB20_08483 [Fusarium fujikuroi]|uniref:Uncharacterized protein n=1 Tax=Fusarium fujikuroi TaxID=5127 RepID=A0A2H3S7X7_FUSFU|nr:hypothetical protein CEK27_002997 [Fusarium fujikuroi]SCN89341.1 uncharacterized protein FFB20_08483 [Fusarium fujikuroi]SCO16243.1 uncharacterized protein FFC1_12781 [Fusarium fujikuroi]SCO20887.1 uncharacterized protein FFE2_14755 [Fusarium fujikuroi]SCO51241.1 uncharacterized protein FFNC_13704 [Fusarium fujikuroi]
MRTNEQGQKIACSKCRVGHRTTACVDAPGHQDEVKAVPRAGRPAGAKTNPVRVAEQRGQKRRRTVDKLQEDQAAAFRVYDLPRAASEPALGGFIARNPQVPVQVYQNLGSLAGPHAPVTSVARRYTFPPNPLPAGLPGPVTHSLEQPVNPGIGQWPVLPALADSVPVSAPPTLNFPVTAHSNAIPVFSFGVDHLSDVGFGMSIPNPPNPPVPSPGSGTISNPLYFGFRNPMPTLGHPSVRPFHPASPAPVSQPVLVNQPGAMAPNSSVNNPVTGFPQVDMIAQVDQVDTRTLQSLQESAMAAEDFVRPAPSIPSPDLFPPNKEVQETVSWDGLIPYP